MREGKAEATERKRRKVVSWKTLQEQSKELLALVLGVMEMWSARVVVLLVATILLHARAGLVLVCGQEFGLETSFYRHSCPAAEIIIRETVADAFQSDSTIVAGLLRMLFHDCFVEGCDGSVLIDSTENNQAEKDAPINLSLHGFEVIDSAKASLEVVCPGVVSCADILALATRDAVFLAGGPRWEVRCGRRDGRTSLASEPGNGQLPGPFALVPELARIFAAKGLSQQDMVVLSGAHTVGGAHCKAFSNRIYNFSTQFATDPTMNADFADELRDECPLSNNGGILVELDSSPTLFDNSYFVNLVNAEGLLTSDQVLFTDPVTRFAVAKFSKRRGSFFREFGKAMARMSEIGIKTGDDGEVRASCRSVNPF